MCLFVANAYCAVNHIFVSHILHTKTRTPLTTPYLQSLHALPQNKNISLSMPTFKINTLLLLAGAFFYVKILGTLTTAPASS